MARIRTVALGAALVAATVGSVNAQTTQGTRPDTAKAGVIRRGEAGGMHGQMGHADHQGMERRMRARHGQMGQMGRMGPGARGQFRRGMQGRPGMPGMPGMDFIHSLKLTDAQRTQIRAIHEKYQPQLKTIHEKARTEFESARGARQRGDTAAVKAALQQSRQNIESQMASIHEQMFREVRGVLTAEQRAQVDAKIAERIKRLDEQKARLERLRR